MPVSFQGAELLASRSRCQYCCHFLRWSSLLLNGTRKEVTPSALSFYHPRRLDKAVASCLTTVADSDMACGNDRKEFIYHLPSKVSVSFVLHILPLFTKDTHGPVLFPSAGTLGNGRGGRRPASPRSSPCGYVQPSVLWQMLQHRAN